MDAQNFDALVDFRFAPAFWHWRRIDIKPFDFNETVRLEAVGKLYRSIASGSVGKRNRFVSIARLRITTESNFAALRLARSTSKIVEWEKKKRAKRTKNVLQCPMC